MRDERARCDRSDAGNRHQRARFRSMHRKFSELRLDCSDLRLNQLQALQRTQHFAASDTGPGHWWCDRVPRGSRERSHRSLEIEMFWRDTRRTMDVAARVRRAVKPDGDGHRAKTAWAVGAAMSTNND
jgi:hypothetical protein